MDFKNYWRKYTVRVLFSVKQLIKTTKRLKHYSNDQKNNYYNSCSDIDYLKKCLGGVVETYFLSRYLLCLYNIFFAFYLSGIFYTRCYYVNTNICLHYTNTILSTIKDCIALINVSWNWLVTVLVLPFLN